MTFASAKDWAIRRRHVLFFVSGFLFDAVTLVRIDSILDLLIQAGYLLAITWILIQQVKVERGAWAPSARISKVWRYETDAIHFFYGGLLSAYVILYFKSASASRSVVFLLLIAILMLINEMPQVQKAGFKMRLGLHAFCIMSFLNYLIPVLVGRMGDWTFALAVILTGVITFYLIRYLIRLMPEEGRQAWFSMAWPPALILVVIVALYSARWIPPVPLSLKYIGIYHDVQRDGPDYRLIYPKPPFYLFWRKESNPFLARPGDSIHCFVGIFAPRRFTHQMSMVWSVKPEGSSRYITSDRIPLPIYKDRDQNYRGVGAKSRFEPGKWRIEIQTEDGRSVGEADFKVRNDTSTDERVWKEVRM